jgi:hypothetical protein
MILSRMCVLLCVKIGGVCATLCHLNVHRHRHSARLRLQSTVRKGQSDFGYVAGLDLGVGVSAVYGDLGSSPVR